MKKILMTMLVMLSVGICDAQSLRDLLKVPKLNKQTTTQTRQTSTQSSSRQDEKPYLNLQKDTVFITSHQETMEDMGLSTNAQKLSVVASPEWCEVTGLTTRQVVFRVLSGQVFEDLTGEIILRGNNGCTAKIVVCKKAWQPKELTSEQREKLQQIINNMIYIEGGQFRMGADYAQTLMAKENEYPAITVSLSPYYINKYEVTVDEWNLVMADHRQNYRKTASIPAEESWELCKLFTERLSFLTGKKFRMPTEAEWEYAARGGAKSFGYTYAGSFDPDEVANYGVGPRARLPVGSKKPNELGLYDMSGNVSEWCLDCYGSYPQQEAGNVLKDYVNTTKHPEDYRVVRGASYINNHTALRVTSRGYSYKEAIGLRLVMEAE